MALFKEITSDSGVVATYHKIVSFNDNRLSKVATIELSSFLSEATKHLEPISSQTLLFEVNATLPYEFEAVYMDVVGMNHIKKCYDIIKTMTDFIGALDV
jgi:hypothetical protein